MLLITVFRGQTLFCSWIQILNRFVRGCPEFLHGCAHPFRISAKLRQDVWTILLVRLAVKLLLHP